MTIGHTKTEVKVIFTDPNTGCSHTTILPDSLTYSACLDVVIEKRTIDKAYKNQTLRFGDTKYFGVKMPRFDNGC